MRHCKSWHEGRGYGDIDEVESGCEGGATWMMRVCIEKE